MCGDGKGNRVHVFRAALADWARRVEECEWGSGVLMAPRDRNDVPLLLGDFVRREKDGVMGEVRRISGSSPRMRGARETRMLKTHEDGIIPAYAGSTVPRERHRDRS